MASGKAEKVTYTKPKTLGRFTLYGEQVFLPDSDLILLMRVFKKPDGKHSNIAWSPQDSKFYWVNLTFTSGGKPVVFKKNRFSWSDALHYDPKLKVVLLNNSSAWRVWILKFDKEKADMEEIKEETTPASAP